MIALFGAVASAQVTSRMVNVCVDYDVAFTDARQNADGLGDFWDDNAVNRAGIGLAYTVSTSVDSVSDHLDTAGCMLVALKFPGPTNQTFTFRVTSSTRRRGIDLHFRYNDTPVVPNSQASDDYWWEDAAPYEQTWTGLTVPPSGVAAHTVVIPAIEGWQFLAVATWIIHRNDWNLDTPVSRSCCVDGAAGLDGTCWNTQTYGYKRVQDPYLTAQPKIFIQGIWDVGTGHPAPTGSGCCSSVVRWDGAPANTGDRVVGMAGGVDERNRYVIAHELGHVLVGVRTGGREDSYPHDAPNDGCMGTRWGDGAPVDPGGSPGGIGELTKEYGSAAFREGWANWVSAWTWNSVSGADCEYKYFTFQDFDLDADLDNQFNDWRDGAMDCMGDPPLFADNVPPPLDLAAFPTTSVNWLADALDASACDPFTGPACTSATRPTMESRNRGTTYDVMRMTYQLYKHDGLAPEQLSNLYVDMCPRAWRETDGACTDDDDLPLSRWEISATHHGLSTPVSGRIDRVEH